MAVHRIGVLTGGGDCPGLNAVIRAVVKTAIGEYDWEVIGVEDGFEGLIRNRMRRLTVDDVRGILPRGGTILGTTNRGNPFALRTVEDGRAVVRDVSRETVVRIRELMDVLVVIGGDGSLRIAYELTQLGASIVGIPKTIDNDLSATDVTFGFETAVQTATEAIDRLHTTAESHHRTMVVEVMGRNVGWIALMSGIAGGADVILIPEIPFSPEALCQKIHARQAAGRTFSIVVAAEGAVPIGGTQTIVERYAETGLVRLGGVSYRVAEMIEQLTGLETRVTVLGHLQRGGSPAASDRILATRFGGAAVRAVADGYQAHMVALHGTSIAVVGLAEAVAVQKAVPIDGEIIRTARGLGIVFG
ncbi:MAG: 6-phosphofructokinase [Chloroflexi bacterium]|nr:6-phosphofructokinase [Chloroflexota bacterium]